MPTTPESSSPDDWRARADAAFRRLRRSWHYRIASSLARLLHPGRDAPEKELRRLFRDLRPEGEKKPRKEPLVPKLRAALQDAGSGNRCGGADVIVCVHNSPEDTEACLRSLESSTNLRRHRLILVDDGSDWKTRALVIRYSSRLSALYLRNETAQGYARAANQGLRRSTASCAVLLNSDTIVTPGWLERLVSCANSAPNVACVGPLSNAASWQSIPDLVDLNGKWKVNELPAGLSVEEAAHRVALHSSRLFPSVGLVNGFCLLITRKALDEVGPFDEESFPLGYGEEDDFCLRAERAGFEHRIADHCYVFHGKSKSFTPERRERIVATSKEALELKHGSDAIRSRVQRLRSNEALRKARVAASIAMDGGYQSALPVLAATPLRIGWFEPHLRAVGGIRRAIEMTNRWVGAGHSVSLLTPDGVRTDWLPIAADVERFEGAKRQDFDVLIVSDPDTMVPFAESKARLKVNYHLAAYLLYREENQALKAYYARDSGMVHVANSRWTAGQFEHRFRVEGIYPGGVDPRQFHPVGLKPLFDVVCYGSQRPHKGTDTIERAAEAWKLLKIAEHAPDQRDLKALIGSGRLFASACWHEGFNLCALEAMACGVPVAMTDDGGSRDYARDEENCLLVAPKDVTALRSAMQRILEDETLRLKLIENGLRTAARFSWDRVAGDFLGFLEQHLEARKTRAAHGT